MKYTNFTRSILDVTIASLPEGHGTLIVRVVQGRVDTNYIEEAVKESFYPDSGKPNKPKNFSGHYKEREKKFITWVQDSHKDGYYAIKVCDGYPSHAEKLSFSPELLIILELIKELKSS